MKKLLITLLTGAVLMSLPGCGQTAQTQGSTAETEQSEPAGDAAEAGQAETADSKSEAESESESKTTDKEPEKITFCLDWTPNTNHTGLYVAKELGYYEEAGLDVSIVQPPENGQTTMCASGQAQFAIEAQDTLAAAFDRDNPLEVTAVAAVLQHNTSGIISRKGDGITSPAGLQDKMYSTWESPIEIEMLRTLVTEDGGDFEKVKLIPNTITDEAAGIASKQTDAIWVFYGWGGINADIENVPYDFWYFSDLKKEFDYYTPIVIANNEFLKAEPETAKAFLAATRKGYEYAIDNPAEAAQILIKGDDTGALSSAEELVNKSQEYMVEKYIEDAPKWGYIDSERWNGFYGWLKEAGVTTKDLTGVGFTDEYLE